MLDVPETLVTADAAHASGSPTGSVDEAALAAFEHLAASRRSLRRYRAKPVSRALLQRLIACASQAPSNFNRQPWQFVLMDDPAWVAALHGVLLRGCARMEAGDAAGRLFNLIDHIRDWLYPLQGSAALVLAFYKPSPEKVDAQMSAVFDSGPIADYNPNLVALGMALQNLLLAAHAAGLGGCMHSGPLPLLRGTVNRLLGLPMGLQLAGLVSLGWPDEAPAAPPHRGLDKTLRICEGAPPATWAATYAAAQA